MVEPRPLRTLAFRAMTFLAAAGCLMLATEGLRAQPDRLRLTSVELTLIKSAAAPAAFMAAADETVDRRKGDCLADFRRGAMAVAFMHLRDAPDAPASRSAARTAIEERLRCAPADGNAWLLLAETAGRDAENPERIAALLQASRSYAPYEGWIIERRLAFACSAGQASSIASTAVTRADFATLLAAQEFRRAAQLYETCGKDAIRELDAALAGSPSDVRAGFARSIAASLPPA